MLLRLTTNTKGDIVELSRTAQLKMVNEELKGVVAVRYNSQLGEFRIVNKAYSQPFSDVGTSYTDNLEDAIATAYDIASHAGLLVSSQYKLGGTI